MNKLPFQMFVVYWLIPCILAIGTNSFGVLRLNDTTGTCKEMLDSFAFMTSNFTYCAIRHARPITLCQQCVTSYLQVKSVYSDILHIEDMGGDVCRDQLINLDKLQVVSSAFDYVDQLWARAFCNTCFTFDHGKARLTDSIAQLLNASVVLDGCILANRNTSLFPDTPVCTKCQSAYATVNSLYNNIKADTGDINFCMDIIDMMNTTRYDWAREIGCINDRKTPEKTFMTILAGIIFASFLFYLMVFLLTRKEEYPVAPQKRWKEQFIKRTSISSAVTS